MLKGGPALVDSTSTRWGVKASYYSAVYPETGEVEVMEIQQNSNAVTSTDPDCIGATAGEVCWTTERDLGQRPSASW